MSDPPRPDGPPPGYLGGPPIGGPQGRPGGPPASSQDSSKSGKVAVWLLLFFPIGVILMWKWRVWSVPIRVALTAVFLFIAAQMGRQLYYLAIRVEAAVPAQVVPAGPAVPAP